MNSIPTHKALLAGLALAASVATFTGSAQAAATISQGYYQDSALKNCANAVVCAPTFAAIPAGKTLILQHVSCITQANTTNPLISMTISSKVGGLSSQRTNYLTPTLMGTVGGTRNWNTNNDVLDLILGSEIPVIQITLSGAASVFTANCSISGQIKP